MILLNMVDYFPDWWEGAECRKDVDYKIFIGDDTSTGKLNLARTFCTVCPVASDCLTHALETPERFGIWAGTSASSRTSMISDVEKGMATVGEVVKYVLSHRYRWRRNV